MSMIKAITIRLDLADYERLAAEAKRQGVSLGALARDYVRANLESKLDKDAERRRRIGLEALDRLEELRAELRQNGYPSVDAARVVREGREELEQRPAS